MTKQKFYETIERCLSPNPSINSDVRKDKAVTKLKGIFLETIARDKSNERDLLLRQSGTFRGRIRWSISCSTFFVLAHCTRLEFCSVGVKAFVIELLFLRLLQFEYRIALLLRSGWIALLNCPEVAAVSRCVILKSVPDF